jgi:hypothetical protein
MPREFTAATAFGKVGARHTDGGEQSVTISGSYPGHGLAPIASVLQSIEIRNSNCRLAGKSARGSRPWQGVLRMQRWGHPATRRPALFYRSRARFAGIRDSADLQPVHQRNAVGRERRGDARGSAVAAGLGARVGPAGAENQRTVVPGMLAQHRAGAVEDKAKKGRLRGHCEAQGA